MVTKRACASIVVRVSSYSSKKSYGNKTVMILLTFSKASYSSKKSYGNKTDGLEVDTAGKSYSSKKSYGNKTSNTCYHIFKNNKILNIL